MLKNIYIYQFSLKNRIMIDKNLNNIFLDNIINLNYFYDK